MLISFYFTYLLTLNINLYFIVCKCTVKECSGYVRDFHHKIPDWQSVACKYRMRLAVNRIRHFCAVWPPVHAIWTRLAASACNLNQAGRQCMQFEPGWPASACNLNLAGRHGMQFEPGWPPVHAVWTRLAACACNFETGWPPIACTLYLI
jgi:hypothetical protein